MTKVEPAPGAVVSTTDKVVTNATKKASSIAPQPTPPPAAPISTARREAPTPPAERVEPPSGRTTVQPQPVEPQPVEPQPDSSASTGRDVYYKNCDAAKAAGAAPLKRGEPGYRPELDRDKDGTACDK